MNKLSNKHKCRSFTAIFLLKLKFRTRTPLFMGHPVVLDPFDDKHIAALHHTYMDKINSKLRIWQKAWSNQLMHTTRSSPYRLWIAGQVQNPTGLDQSIADWQNLELKVMLTSKMISKKKADQYFFQQYWNLVKTADLNLHLLFHIKIITE